MITLSKMPIMAADKEVVTGETYTYSSGFGQLTKAGATVQKGATVTANVDIKMKVVTNEQTNSWYKEHKDTYTKEQQSEIESHLNENNTSSAWWAIFAHGASGHQDRDFKEKKNYIEVDTTTAAEQEIVKSISNIEAKEVQVTGQIKIIGYSYMPTTAFVFAQMTTITFEDGTKAQVINSSDPIAADKTGDTTSVRTDSNQKLNITPIG